MRALLCASALGTVMAASAAADMAVPQVAMPLMKAPPATDGLTGGG